MCEYCNPKSNECEVYFEPLTHEHFIDVKTFEWDYYYDDYVSQRVYISYCPWCGRKLDEPLNKEQNKGCSGCLHFRDKKYKCELCARFGHMDHYVSNN